MSNMDVSALDIWFNKLSIPSAGLIYRIEFSNDFDDQYHTLTPFGEEKWTEWTENQNQDEERKKKQEKSV